MRLLLGAFQLAAGTVVYLTVGHYWLTLPIGMAGLWIASTGVATPPEPPKPDVRVEVKHLVRRHGRFL